MRISGRQSLALAAVGLAAIVVAARGFGTVQTPGGEVRIDDNDIGGVVTGVKGPEAGVWVIAETKDQPTGLRKIVVTDDRGRYLVPDLPKGTYTVWVRGYGLVDSPKSNAAPGTLLNLTSVQAPDARTAAEYYPASYWYSLLTVPAKDEFPGTGGEGNGIPVNTTSQAQWIDLVKTDACFLCHQLGSKATREIPKALGTFGSSLDAWKHRLVVGHDGLNMLGKITRFGAPRALALFADWTDRIAAGELPPAPPRPQGAERNVVITQWDWGRDTDYFHDAISTDKRSPTVNANGPIFGLQENSADLITVLNPSRHAWAQVPVPVRDPKLPIMEPQTFVQPSPYWGNQIIWNSRASPHSVAMDARGRLWMAAATRPPSDNPLFCKDGSLHPSARLFRAQPSLRQVTMYDPASGQFTNIDTCAGTHHVNFAEDADNTLWFSGPGSLVVGWLNTKVWDATHDAQQAQGWAPLIIDTNGNGRQDAWVEQDQPLDPTKDKRLNAFLYGIVTSAVDGSVWGTLVHTDPPSLVEFPGGIARVTLGANPPSTTLTEIYQPPYKNPRAPIEGFGPRGLDVDRNGVVWTAMGSGHFASFDRRKCKGPLNGPTATGQHCPEGWTLHQVPGPQFKNVTDPGSADSNYYNWVDQFDALGLGRNVPIATGNGSESLLALRPDTGEWVVMRVPYPMGFFAKGMDGRIDDPTTGWKGRGVWTTFATRTIWHVEGGRGTTSKAVRFQIRPDPLAK